MNYEEIGSCSCEAIEDIVRRVVSEELSKIKTTSRGKRKPSKYNLFMKECIKGKEGAIQDRFRACALEYKEKKEKGEI